MKTNWLILGSGPSATDVPVKQFQRNGFRVIAVNDAIVLAPRADICFAADTEWLRANMTKDRPDFETWTATSELTAPWLERPHWVSSIRRIDLDQLFFNVYAVGSGGCSGFQALNLAWHFGAQNVVLGGFDMQEVGGKKHFHPDHPWRNPDETVFDRWRRAFVLAHDDILDHGGTLYQFQSDKSAKIMPMIGLEDAVRL